MKAYENTPENNSNVILKLMLGFSLAFLVAALCAGNLGQLIPGFVTIVTAPSQFTKDYFAFGGLGSTFLNVGLVGMACWAISKFSGLKANGTTVAGYFLCVGFSPFGLNFVNIWPFFLGVFLYSKYKKAKFNTVANLAMFATALAPFASEMLFRYPNAEPVGFTFLGLILALIIGVVTGFCMPALCAHAQNFHKGFDLYNAGPAAGFLAMVYFCLMYKCPGIEKPGNTLVGDGNFGFVLVFCLVIFLACLIAGYIMNGKSFKGYGELLKDSGHKVDFGAKYGAPVMTINFGVYGLFLVAVYTILHVTVGAKFTGPTFGAILCAFTFVAAGAHPMNYFPIVIGYVLMSFYGSWDMSTQGILVGMAFASGVAPIAGKYGVVAGILAGAIHAALVTTVPDFHGGFCLYNGGFTSGIVAFVMIPVLESFCKTKEEKLAAKLGTGKTSAGA